MEAVQTMQVFGGYALSKIMLLNNARRALASYIILKKLKSISSNRCGALRAPRWSVTLEKLKASFLNWFCASRNLKFPHLSIKKMRLEILTNLEVFFSFIIESLFQILSIKKVCNVEKFKIEALWKICCFEQFEESFALPF